MHLVMSLNRNYCNLYQDKIMNSKDKGNGFERKISKRLSDRFKTVTGKDQSFRRNIDSGSFFGGTNQRRTVTHNLDKANFGDIVCPDNFVYNIECKHYKSPPSFALLAKQACKDWDKWMEQSLQDSYNAKKKPLLIVKYNGVSEIVILNELPDNLDYFLKYNNWYVTTLDLVLALTDEKFFIQNRDKIIELVQ